MKLSAAQAKTFRRIQRRHKVSSAFLLRNMPAILKFVQYAITPHIVLKCKLIRRRNRVFLRHNHPRKLIFDPSQLKKRKRAKRIHSQWSKRMVMHLKRYYVPELEEAEMAEEANEDEPTPPITDAKLPEKVVTEQMKQQLELLNTGIRRTQCFQKIRKELQLKITDCTDSPTRDDIKYMVDKNYMDDLKNDADPKELANGFDTPLNVDEIVNDADEQDSTGSTKPPMRLSSENVDGNFIDALLSIVNSATDSKSNTPQCTTMEPPKKQSSTITANRLVVGDDENSNSSSDFLGFDDNERISGSMHLDQKHNGNKTGEAIFISDFLDTYMRDNSLGSSAVVKTPVRRPNNGLVANKSTPPKLDMPALPEELLGVRTVAERRTFFQKSKNVKFCLIKNVNTIYHELRRCIKGQRINKPAIETLLMSNSVPLTRDGWKAATWLLTDVGNHYFQRISIDGEHVDLYGCRGNSPRKFRRPQTSRVKNSSPLCKDDCIDRIIFRALRPIRTLERRSKLGDALMNVTYKACPLSQKIVQLAKDEEEPVYQNLKIMRMPQVELEVFPQLQKPLNDIAKRYLQLILPYDGISREWAEFSVSTLLERQKMEATTSGAHSSFTFKLPYRNDRDSVLVRRMHDRSEKFDNSEFSFRKEVDERSANDDTPDLLAKECADVLTDILNSVAISCSENSFIKNDPDNIYEYKISEDDVIKAKSVKKPPELHHHQQYKKQTKLMMELKRLNATIIDAASSKTEEDCSTCDKEICKLGCVCASLNEGTTVRQHCGKQRCVLDCNCKCPSVMRLETDGRTITTEDAFMLRRQATAKLARMEKEFTSTVVLTGSETLLINESQYAKKRRCTKVPKRYGDFVDPDEPNFNDNKKTKRIEPPKSVYIPREPILVKDKIYQRLNHCSVNIKRLRDVDDLAPWCMVHMVYRCHCKGQAIVGNPIVLEKQEDQSDEGTTIDESLGSLNTRSCYSFEKNDLSKTKQKSISSEFETYDSDTSDSGSLYKTYVTKAPAQNQQKPETRGRKPDIDCIGVYMNAQANHCRRVVPIPKNTYLRRNRKRVARIQLFIAENETDQTKLSLNEHVLRSVYYHKNNTNAVMGKIAQPRNEFTLKTEETAPLTYANVRNRKTYQSTSAEKHKPHEDDNERLAKRRRRMISQSSTEEGASLLRVNHYKNAKRHEKPTTSVNDYPNSDIHNTSTFETIQSPEPPPEEIIVPKILQVCSLNAQAAEMCTDNAPSVAAGICQQMKESDACIENVDSHEFKNLFQIVIKNMNNLVSKKMQDIDLALRRESKAIPMPNEEILCIIRWRNFLEAFTDGCVYLWEVRTMDMTFLAATIRNIMPLVVNALSVVNIRALPKDGLPLLGKMLIDQVSNTVTDGLAVVMQGYKLYWFVKGFLRPDKTRVCPKPTPETHPLLTKKINVLCRLLMTQQVNDFKKRQENSMNLPLEQSNSLITQSNVLLEQPCNLQPVVQQSMLPESGPASPRKPHNVAPKVKVLPMQRNISDEAKNILEQMLTQAYGLVRSNISFRKLRQSELKELCNPASVRDDHQWLVLDIRNDFSHIFIPELGDLLTLDRVFKVMTYSVSKNRIVKMQFGQKSLFNVYVTPVSHRKLYFGPFRNSFLAPKLVLFQSVNGQMMLREVYESRHNVAMKTDKTCAFWLTQRRGNLYFDVEPEVLQTTIPNSCNNDIHEIVDDDDVSPIPSTELADTVQEDIVVVQNIPILDEKEPEQLSDTTRPHTEDDDDCMIIEDSVNPQTLPVNNPVVTPTPERINFTISYGGDNSSLVVVHNDGEIFHDGVQKAAQNSFTMLSPEFVMSSESTGQQSQNLLLPLNPIESMKPQELPTVITIPTIEVVTPSIDIPAPNSSEPKLSVPVKLSKSSVSSISTLGPSATKVPLKQTLTPSVTKMTIPAKFPETKLPQPTPVTTPAVEEATKESTTVPSSAQAGEVQNSADETESHKTDANIQNIKSAAIKWNRNVTITKLSVDSEGNETKTVCLTSNPKQVSPSQSQNTITVVSTSTGKVVIKNQPSIDVASMKANALSQIRPIGTRQIVARATAPNTYRNPNNPHANQMHAKPNIPQIRPVSAQQCKPNTIRKVLPVIHGCSVPGQRPTSHGGLSVRTPTAINTLVRTVQPQQLIRNLAPATTTSPLQPTNASSRMRVSTTLPASVNRVPGSAPNTFKFSPNAVFLKKTPNSALSANTKGVQQPPQSRRIITSVNVEGPTQSKIRKLITGLAQSQTDPLEISPESDTAVNQILQHKLPNQMGSTNPNGQVLIGSPGTTTDAIGIAVKRNSTGTVVNRKPAQLIPAKQSPQVTTGSATIVTPVSSSSPSKGIPIELPRLKKFAIIGSANTTVITPMTRPTGEKNATESPSNATSSDSAVAQKKKVVLASGVSKRPSIGTAAAVASTNSSPTPASISKTIMKVITPTGSSKPKTANPISISQPIEYGYFFGNIEGLPKFVVKRSNDDYLIKVPNFNGILKLTGLATVHNYLNQYIIQKCGKTTADLKNIKWTFKTQDRSKLNNLNQSNAFNVKPANTNTKFQKVIPIKRTEPTAASSSTSTTATTVANNNAKSLVPPAKKFSSVILVDDE